MNNEQIIELETRLSFLEHSLHELNNAIIRQARQIERLEQVNGKLIERVQELAESSNRKPPEHEIPPHY